jgi:DNA-binding response OmpR family regulator
MSSIKKILIAEDELIIARVLKRVLEQSGYEVIQVSDENNAVLKAVEFRPDLIILDIHLKQKSSGVHAGRELRKREILCPIVFTTGNSYEQTKAEIKEIKNCHLLIKPIDPAQILSYIKSIEPS